MKTTTHAGRTRYIAALDRLEQAIKFENNRSIAYWLAVVDAREDAADLDSNDYINMRADNLINQANDLLA